MTDTPKSDLVAAINWLKNKHAANPFSIGYMAARSSHEDHEIDHIEAVLKGVVSGELTPASAEPVAWAWIGDDGKPTCYTTKPHPSDIGVLQPLYTTKPHPSDIGVLQPLYAHPAPMSVLPDWIARCCQCNRLVDTRENDEGGDIHGRQMDDGTWVCCGECWEKAAGVAADPMTVEAAAQVLLDAFTSEDCGVDFKLAWQDFQAKLWHEGQSIYAAMGAFLRALSGEKS